MKFWNIIPLVITSAISTQTLADINVSIPQQLKLQLVNGKTSNSENTLLLKNGKNQIGFRYKSHYREDGENQLFSSDIILLSFKGNDQEYIITFPRLQSKKELEQFNKKPVVILKDSKGQNVPFEQGKLIKNGLQLSRDLVTELAVYNQTDKPASLNQPTRIIIPKNSKSEGEIAGQMLDYWYRKADQKTRIKFKKSIQ